MYHDIAIKVGCKSKPQDIRQKQPCRWTIYKVCRCKIYHAKHIEQYNIDEPEYGAAHIKEKQAPQYVQYQLYDKQYV